MNHDTWVRDACGLTLIMLITLSESDSSPPILPITRRMRKAPNSLIFVDYIILILYDYQENGFFRQSVQPSMLLDSCSWFLAVTLCLSTLCTPIAVCSCPVCQSRSDSSSPLLALFSLAPRCFTGHRSVHVAPLCTYRSAATSTFRLRHDIGLSSSPTMLVGFLVMSVVSFDVLLIIVVLELVIHLLSSEDKFRIIVWGLILFILC